ncbi:hypothetical protein P3581_05275 [Vibrio parahaemolyticus]|uniref:hypothetical protein n=1 Tax=Vibrio parahaemolyticus TaxID=670 RepID=UPI000FEC51C4|nr:hypothetical protein [Vibrio parahaemolyticus]MCC3789402.1 hypothetical protein [Vibrio parahaemolyticus]MDF4982357.1 hypothetical protein [Vibrio parahaemolyticus]HCG9741802.1 hypothetical protein [Vibrio parahaemolyticus]HCH1876093.1 hypothetical protein [Vibrio parahaemolyticus]HCZ9665589.1 hypothetical protein [Vibrio parahaemolyticus]
MINEKIVQPGFNPQDIEDIHGHHDQDKKYFLCLNCGTHHPVPFDGAGHVWFPVEWENNCCGDLRIKAIGL